MKRIISIAFLTAATIVSTALTLGAAQINGSITFAGGTEFDSDSVDTATKVTGWINQDGTDPSVKSSFGDFATLAPTGSPASFVAPWSFNSGPILAFWQVGGFRFDLTSSIITFQGSGFVIAVGTGWISGNGFDPTPGVFQFSSQDPSAGGVFSFSSANAAVPAPPPLGAGDTATIGFWHNKNGQALILSAPNQPALGNWLAINFPCMFGGLAGKSNNVVAALFLTDFNVKGQKTYAQVLAGALACYFTSSMLAGNGAAKYGFNVTPGGTGAKTFNVGSMGSTIGLQNNMSYTVLQILTAANQNCPFSTAVFNALNTIFDGINTTGDIN